MLTPEQKLSAERMLKSMSSDMDFEKKIKGTIKDSTKKIQDLIHSLKDDPKEQRNLLKQIQNKFVPQILALEQLNKNFLEVEEKMKADNERLGKQKLFAIQDREKLKVSIEEINDTIKKIQKTVQESIKEEAAKRLRIQEDLEKSLGEIREKISTFEKESVELQTENKELSTKKKQIQQKMENLESDFKNQAEEKDNEVKIEKQELMEKLKALEGEVSEVTEVNKQFSALEKNNFDKKLSLYLKTKKFPEYSNSFENSAKTIDQCKQELAKGVQRLVEAKSNVEKYEKDSKDQGNAFLMELKKKTEKEAKVSSVKKQKQDVRERIITLQDKIKEIKAKE